jgi:UDP-N-acetylenolpyruvoylglucosamine reductase
MANVREPVRLSRFTTLGLGGPARRFVVAGTDEEIIAAVRTADQRGEPLLVLGGGSNLVISDETLLGRGDMLMLPPGTDWRGKLERPERPGRARRCR